MSPLDLSFVVRRFIDRIRPRLVIFNELEIWPNWISLLRRRRVPMLLINGRVSDTAFRRYRVFRLILRPFFRRRRRLPGAERALPPALPAPAHPGRKDHGLRQHQGRRGREQRAGPAARRRRSAPTCGMPAPARRSWSWPAATTRDEKVFIPAIPDFGDDYFFIIVPRHVQRAPAIAARLQRLGVRQALYSRREAGDCRTRRCWSTTAWATCSRS